MGHFLPFYPLNNPKNQNFEKMKKNPGDVIIWHKCTKNNDHMLYCSWDIVCNEYNCYFSFWAIFCTFTSLTAQNIKIKKKWGKQLEISSFYNSAPNILYCSWDMVRNECNCYFSFWAIFCPFTSLTAWKIKIKKKKRKKRPGDIIILQ